MMMLNNGKTQQGIVPVFRNRLIRLVVDAIAATATAALVVVASVPPSLARERDLSSTSKPAKKRVSAGRFIMFKPFIVPVFQGGQVRSHFTGEIALEITDEDYFQHVWRLTPKIRDAFYDLLFRLLSLRGQHTDSPGPRLEVVKRDLFIAAHEVVPKVILSAVLVQRVFERRLR